ncbi:NAD(P)H-binding protein [Flindersiella endophytica]
MLLTGGTGTLGRLVAPLLADAGRKVRVLSRTAHEPKPSIEYVRGDLTTGEGVERAVADVDTIVHCAGTQKGDGDKARLLVEAARKAGNPHLVYISVVGAERIPVESGVDRSMFAYFESKRAAELVIEQSGLPWTNLRATQFHDLTLMTARALAKLPVVPYFSGIRFQPVDTREVAERMAELALGEPAGIVPELGGPQVYEMKELVRSYLKTAGKRRLLVPLRAPGAAARALRQGANLTRGEQRLGHRTWEDFLAARLAR